MKVDFTVPEQNLPNLKIGQSSKFGISEGNLNLAGQITGIDPKVDPQTRLVSLEALIDNVDSALRPGQFIRIRVELPPEPDVVALPQTAVVASLYGDYVFAVEPAPADPKAPAATDASKPAPPKLVARQIFVKTGRRNGGVIEIVDGLKAGEKIITAGQNRLSNGTPVAIDNTIDPSKLITSAKEAN